MVIISDHYILFISDEVFNKKKIYVTNACFVLTSSSIHVNLLRDHTKPKETFTRTYNKDKVSGSASAYFRLPVATVRY